MLLILRVHSPGRNNATGISNSHLELIYILLTFVGRLGCVSDCVSIIVALAALPNTVTTDILRS